MRILMVTQFYPPPVGGQERHVRDLAHELGRRGHHVEVATIGVHGVGADADGDVVVHRITTSAQRVPRIYADPRRPHALPLPDPGLRAGLSEVLAAGRFDVAHAHDWSVASLVAPARAARVPVLLTQHDYSHVCATKRMMRNDEVPCPGPAAAACLRCAARQHGPIVGPGVLLANTVGRRLRRHGVDAFVPVSTAVQRATMAGVERSTVIPNFVPDELRGAGPAPMPGEATAPILFVGDLVPDKGVAVLFDAFRSLADPPPLQLAGRSYPQTPTDLPEGATMLGVLPPAEVASAMRAAQVVVVPSICPDACPTVVLEAMAAGRPVVASATGGIPDLVEEGVTGVLVAPDDHVALAAALRALLSDPEQAAAMGRRGWGRAAGFTASVVAARLEDLYRELATAP